MIDKCNVCFYKGEVKLLLGESDITHFPSQNDVERDLRVLGSIIGEIASCRSFQNSSF
jgi:hypothetical protein